MLTALLVCAHGLVHCAAWCWLWRRTRWPERLLAAAVPVLVPLYVWEARERHAGASAASAWLVAWGGSLGAVALRLALV